MVPITQQERSSIQDSIGPPSTRMPMTLSPVVTFVNVKEKLRNVMRCHKLFVATVSCYRSFSWSGVVLSVFAMVAACTSRAAKTLSATSFLMAASVMDGAADVDVLLRSILSTVATQH
ncbi:hypothetical protein Tco_0391550 [Tanacetum coccineum]